MRNEYDKCYFCKSYDEYEGCEYSCENKTGFESNHDRIIAKADIFKLVSEEFYKPWLMQKRNEYMVDLADKVIAVWDGSKSGTGNCVKYAEKCGKEIIRIKP